MSGLDGSLKRRKELEKYAQARVERAGYDLNNIADILRIISLEDNGENTASGDMLEFLGDLIAERASIVINEGNKASNWAKAERWGGK